MSYITQPDEGLTSVATDATLTGDGTSGSPLSVVDNYLETVAVDGITITGDGTVGDPLVATGGGGSVYSVHKGVLTAGPFAAPLPSPASVYPNASTWFATTIVSPDVSVGTGAIVCNSAGTYKISLQFSFDKIPDPSQHDVQINLGLTDAPPNPLLYENITYQHFESNGVGQFSAEFQTIVEATAGQSFQIHFTVGGTPSPATVDYYFGAEAGFLLVERVA